MSSKVWHPTCQTMFAPTFFSSIAFFGKWHFCVCVYAARYNVNKADGKRETNNVSSLAKVIRMSFK
jgi:hypothetical protein